jgi:hypothetical protein
MHGSGFGIQKEDDKNGRRCDEDVRRQPTPSHLAQVGEQTVFFCDVWHDASKASHSTLAGKISKNVNSRQVGQVIRVAKMQLSRAIPVVFPTRSVVLRREMS